MCKTLFATTISALLGCTENFNRRHKHSTLHTHENRKDDSVVNKSIDGSTSARIQGVVSASWVFHIFRVSLIFFLKNCYETLDRTRSFKQKRWLCG